MRARVVSVGRARSEWTRSCRVVRARAFLDGDDDVDDDDGDGDANAGIIDDSWATRRGGVRTRGDDASRARARCGGERRCDANGVWWRVGRCEGVGEWDARHSYLHSIHSLETLISEIDRSSRRGSVEWIGDAREPGMRMKRDVRETDASSFRFADEGDVQL